MSEKHTGPDRRVTKGLVVAAIAALGFGVGVALADGSSNALERTLNAGWECADLGDGLWHCFDPGDGKSLNAVSINVKVYDQETESFLGTEQLWNALIYAGQPCPQDELLFFPGLVACHHYSH